MNKRKYHYEYFAYTDNMCYGRILIGRGSYTEANFEAQMANKGAYTVVKQRVYDN